MAGARDYLKRLWSRKLLESHFIESEDLNIGAANDEERRRVDPGQNIHGEIPGGHLGRRPHPPFD